MKKILFIITATIISLNIIAQNNGGSIAGTITDIKNTAIVSLTISLLKLKDSSVLKIKLTNDKGEFLFTQIPNGDYFVSINSTNYSSKNSNVINITDNNESIVLDKIILEPAGKNLSSVVVVSRKQLIEQKIDRMVVNVDASVTNVGSTALEILEKSPGINVDKDGNISLKGKSEVMVMIDGKPSYLSGTDLANLLSSMNANQLSQIEIMTNPSAKYDAAGNAGVVNIKTKKSITQGFNGNVTLNYGQGKYPKLNNSIFLNYRTKKLNTFLNYGYTNNKGFLDVAVQRYFMNTAGNKSYELDQYTNIINQSKNNNLKFGADYYINPKTTIGFVSSGFISPQLGTAFTSSFIYDSLNNINSIVKTNKTNTNVWKNGTLNINFNKIFDDNKKELTSNIDYLHYDFSGNQELYGSNYSASEQLQSTSYLKNILPLQIDVFAARVDYTQTLKNNLKLEAGIKASTVQTKNTTLFYTPINNQINFSDTLSNSFNYNENINAAYLNLNKKINKWTLQLGLRAENTNYSGVQSYYSNQKDSTFKHNYISAFPSTFISYQLNENNQISLSVGRRIDRPAYQQLNPFISFQDKYMQFAGNPFLQPQISTNFELSYLYKNIFNTTINYGIINNMINETMSHNDSLITRSVGNIGTRINYGITESATITFSKWLTTTVFANLYNNKYNGMISGYKLDTNQVTFSINVNNQFSFLKNWAAEISGNYTSRNRSEGQSINLPTGQVSVGISKQFLNNEASLKLNFRDIFYTSNPREIQNFQNVQSNLKIIRDSRVISVAFVYRFGSPIKLKPKNNTTTDEQKRIQLN